MIPPRASPTLRCPLAPPSPLIFFIRFAGPRCAPPHHPSPSPPLFVCSLRSQGPDLYVRSSQRPIAPDVSTLRLGRTPASTYGRPYGTTSGRRRAVARSVDDLDGRRGGFPRSTGLDAWGGSPSGGALSTCGPDVRGTYPTIGAPRGPNFRDVSSVPALRFRFGRDTTWVTGCTELEAVADGTTRAGGR